MKIIDVKYGTNTLPFNTYFPYKQSEVISLKAPKQKDVNSSVNLDALRSNGSESLKNSESKSGSMSSSGSISNSCSANSSSSSSRCSSVSTNEKIYDEVFMDSNEIKNWSKNNVQKWIESVCVEHELARPYPLEKFLMNGKGLLLLKKEDFISRSLSCGDVIYQCLKALKKKNPKENTGSETSSLGRSNSSLQSISSCDSSKSSISNTSIENNNKMIEFENSKKQLQTIETTKPKTETKSRYTFLTDYDILNQLDKNMYDYLNYLNSSFCYNYNYTKRTYTEKTEYAFGLKSTKIVYRVNTNQVHLCDNLTNTVNNKFLVQAS